MVHNFLDIPLRRALFIHPGQHAKVTVWDASLSCVLSSFLFALPFRQPVLVYQSPLFAGGICHDLSFSLLGQILPASFVHKFDELLFDESIIFWPR